jgi:hypothetical protein
MDETTDYFVIGCGASAMAFVDVMLKETDATFTIIDKRSAPGGHWNDAYPFVRLHQPASTYGVASQTLGRGHIDSSGTNSGFYELSSGVEITNYYHNIMRDVFLASGRVKYHPMTAHIGKGEFVSLLSGEKSNVRISKKLVDATLLTTSVPQTHERKFDVADGVTCIPPNALPRTASGYRNFMIIGAGKTALDSLSWLLESGAPPESIYWVKPRDSWMFNRSLIQPGMDFFESTIGGMAGQYEVFATAKSVDDLCHRMEAAGAWVRLDEDVWPTMFHAAIVTDADIDQLRKVANVVRMGHVRRIEPGNVILDEGEQKVAHDTLFVDCTASAIPQNVDFRKPVFETDTISLQMIRQFQPCFSAALLGHLEASIEDIEEKNLLSRPTPMVDSAKDWIEVTISSITNQITWMGRENIARWILNSRLDHISSTIAQIDQNDREKLSVIARIRDNAMPAITNLTRLAQTTHSR